MHKANTQTVVACATGNGDYETIWAARRAGYTEAFSAVCDPRCSLHKEAPNLLAALKLALLDRTRDDHTSRLMARVIEKAEGR